MKSVFAIFLLNRKIRKGHSQVLDVKERIVVLQELASPILWGFLSPVIYLSKDKIKGIFFSYPLEAEEGFGTRLERIVSTFGWGGEPML